MAFEGSEFKPNGLNVSEILRVADAVEASATFDMTAISHGDCGTPACIAGHVLAMNGVPKDDWWISDAAKLLGLDPEGKQTDRLFEPLFLAADYQASEGDYGYISNAHAAACLRHLAETGEVDWLATKPAKG